jgi:hypothetical protein
MTIHTTKSPIEHFCDPNHILKNANVLDQMSCDFPLDVQQEIKEILWVGTDKGLEILACDEQLYLSMYHSKRPNLPITDVQYFLYIHAPITLPIIETILKGRMTARETILSTEQVFVVIEQLSGRQEHGWWKNRDVVETYTMSGQHIPNNLLPPIGHVPKAGFRTYDAEWFQPQRNIGNRYDKI